jgi:hypothetical protein
MNQAECLCGHYASDHGTKRQGCRECPSYAKCKRFRVYEVEPKDEENVSLAEDWAELGYEIGSNEFDAFVHGFRLGKDVGDGTIVCDPTDMSVEA